MFFTIATALTFGTMFWDLASKTKKQQNIFNAMGSMYAATMFLGVQNASSVQPIVDVERTVFYRERAAGMYSALSYAFAQRIPIWWRWYYWACPVAWTLYGLVVSQFGDVKDMLDNGKTVEDFARSYFRFKQDFLGVVAVVVAGFAVLFSFIFAFSIMVFNFQRR
nr:abc transporter g family member 53 [Quercus suber]